MKVRRKGYKDYGFDTKEGRRLIDFCGHLSAEDQYILRQCAICAYPEIQDALFESIVHNISYDVLNGRQYIPLSKTDFYAYRRLCLMYFRNFLMYMRKWE